MLEEMERYVNGANAERYRTAHWKRLSMRRGRRKKENDGGHMEPSVNFPRPGDSDQALSQSAIRIKTS